MKKAALIGGKLGHSYSPFIHHMYGDYDYELLEVKEEDIESVINNTDYIGFNVTIPYKKAVIKYMDRLTDRAKKIGSVNVIVREKDGSLTGDNTDYFGFKYLLKDEGIDVVNKKCIVLGNGGVAVTVVAVLEDLGAKSITVISRRGEDNYDNLERHYDAEVIINTTPVGMYPDNGNSVIDIDNFTKCEGVVDLIYNPHKTKLVLDAENKGIKAAGGLKMLVAQALPASESFQGITLPCSLIDKVNEAMEDKLMNIVLIGMPGSGKSYVGKRMAQKLGKDFIDTDEEIVKREGMSIPEIFKEKGEEYFRSVETAVLKDVCSLSGKVIATGGGIVKKGENKDIIRQNAKVIWVKRDLEKLATNGRPISLSTPLEALFCERKDKYTKWCDLEYDNNTENE